MSPKVVTCELVDGVATVRLNRPAALNAISSELAVALAGTLTRLATDPGARAVVVTGSGERAFCVGADLKERGTLDDAGWLRQRELFRRGFAAVRRCPLPTVAAVFGFALGGGTELALSCDLIVASQDAVFGLPEVGLGLVPGGGGTQLLVRRVGRSRAKDLVLTGRRVVAAEAAALGIVDRLVTRADLGVAAAELASAIAAGAPTAVRHAKWAIDAGADLPVESGIEVEDQAWRQAVASDDRREGIAAWNERRAPNWARR